MNLNNNSVRRRLTLWNAKAEYRAQVKANSEKFTIRKAKKLPRPAVLAREKHSYTTTAQGRNGAHLTRYRTTAGCFGAQTI